MIINNGRTKWFFSDRKRQGIADKTTKDLWICPHCGCAYDLNEVLSFNTWRCYICSTESSR